ncbi:hypothetical protein [uncultured Gilliamella sp.]|uniref:alpha-L-rhamnosidase-related protein n=1 Tax=uncultured Gilliamella sp. TaxID=1193505 RepID=UPI0025E06451|nr:hypothetical protein [uncultured Gilliamella sp.]
MAQEIQKNDHVVMVRDQVFISKAENLLPTLYQNNIYPQKIITLVRNANAIDGYSANIISQAQCYLKQSFQTGDSFILDFGCHGVGYLSFLCQPVGSPPDAPAHLKLTFGETLCEIAEPFSQYQGWLSKSWLQEHDEYIDVLPAQVNLPRRYCFRYLKIEVVSLSPKYQILFKNMVFKTVSSAPENGIVYQPTDTQLAKIDQISVLTLRNCMQEVFEDGPKRDRRLWLGDLRLQALVNNVTFQQHDLVCRCLYLFAGHRREDGMVSANVFVKPNVVADDTFLFDYSLFYVDVLYNYFVATNDSQTVKELWPIALKQIELGLNRCDKHGIVADSDDWWSFIDWHEKLNKQGASQGVLIYCLDKALHLAQIFEPNMVPKLQQHLDALKCAANKLWDAKLGFYVSGAQRQVSYATQIWMILADVGDLAHQQKLMNNLLSSPPEIGMNTPYMRHHFIVALFKIGMKNKAIEEIKAYWGKMIEYGADTFWELFDPQNPSYSPYGNKIINSYCHAWSCTPAWFIRHYAL